MRPFALARPRTLAEARRLARGATPLAGGTDLLGLMKSGLAAPERVVDLSQVAALRGLRRDRSGLRIGALTPLADLERGGRDVPPILREAAAVAATPQLRAAGTAGGNLLQRNRCWYFRDAAFPCWLKGGTRCFAREGEHTQHAILDADRCVIVTPSDLGPALVALDAVATVAGARGTRRVPVADLFAVPSATARREHTLREGDLLTEVRVAAAALARRGAFLKQMDRATWSFALVSVAAAARVERGRLRDVRLVLGGVAAVPWRALAAEEAVEGERLDDRAARAAGEAALAGAEPLAQNAYKVPLARELVRRALLRLVA